ncbi:mannose-6-phosphate isomerase, class I [Aquihabitans daechungensis]|uniref:mannose-6-phosphate isomerase, class I n=1 Tax=Aquihabitans daechungensis TaxID=1052257 RepID=UPI003BA03E72
MLLLRNPIQPYAWGPVDGLEPLVGTEPTGDHEAELWVGTHPRGPSTVVGGEHDGRSLAEVIAQDPARWLGSDLAGAGHTALPFLLKVLAIGQPLSLQAHPSAEQAAEGFAREEAAGIPIDATERNYRDPSPKPEALVALTPTWALCGFRPSIEAANLLAGLGVDAFDPLVEALASGGDDGLRTVLGWLLRLDRSSRSSIADAVAASVERLKGDDREDPRIWVRRLVQAFPGDPTAVAPLLLNVVRLEPGEAVHLPAGNLHAYLDGAGVEIMAASDNVLRGGLTPKHVDVDELLSVLRFEPGSPPSRRPPTSATASPPTTRARRRSPWRWSNPPAGRSTSRPPPPPCCSPPGGR